MRSKPTPIRTWRARRTSPVRQPRPAATIRRCSIRSSNSVSLIRRNGGWSMAIRTGLCTALLLLAACASQPKRHEVFLAELAAVLPGSYDNIAQARASGAHAALRVVIAPVQAALLGKHVYYVQEMAADDAQRVM